jgi:hypothetical protein
MAENVKRKWRGTVPTHCDICRKPLSQQFVDGNTIAGLWAMMCAICHSREGCGIGPGKGQRYDLKTLVKIEG